MVKNIKNATIVSALPSAFILTCNTFPVLAVEEKCTVAPHPSGATIEENLLLPVNNQGSTFIPTGAIPSPLTDEEQIDMYMQDSSLTTEEKLDSIRDLLLCIDPSTQMNLIMNTDLSDFEKALLFSECVYTQEEYDTFINYPSVVASGSWYELPGTFTCYQQLTQYFCGPASAKAAIKYLSNQTLDQYDLAKEMGTIEPVIPGWSSGTTIDAMKTCINNHQTSRAYKLRSNIYSQSITTSTIKSDITSYKCPTVILIQNEDTEDNWFYPTDGHFLCVNAISSNTDKIQVSDSIIGTEWDSSSIVNPFYEIESSSAYNAITNYLF